jgi:hypothetical protein
MDDTQPMDLETDPRFPSGRWLGFFLQKHLPPGKHPMELHLTFRDGQMSGEGRDWVGEFLIHGQYQLATGACHWTKRYLGKHDVFYRGYNEGKGIWGIWEIARDGFRGGFHIWPDGMPDPSGHHLTEEADLPVQAEEPVEAGQPVGVS